MSVKSIDEKSDKDKDQKALDKATGEIGCWLLKIKNIKIPGHLKSGWWPLTWAIAVELGIAGSLYLLHLYKIWKLN